MSDELIVLKLSELRELIEEGYTDYSYNGPIPGQFMIQQKLTMEDLPGVIDQDIAEYRKMAPQIGADPQHHSHLYCEDCGSLDIGQAPKWGHQHSWTWKEQISGFICDCGATRE